MIKSVLTTCDVVDKTVSSTIHVDIIPPIQRMRHWMEKTPRDSSYAKKLLVKHAFYDSNKKVLYVYVCF